MVLLTCCIKILSPYHAGIFQNGDLKYFQVAKPPLPLYTRILKADPTPVLGDTPRFFFQQNDLKGCKRDY